ncbi:hypothetical protein KIH74_30885 [Kineosporia sp. J2-2]|uniref:NACHT domain-containing protein n=1 Tax=Kineosporia corallincola TaxID=2835133 RepID=A0ABS5TRG5_9ACTN|nr:hypothetical protein [Kineosporia corallincola]MBT0773392.1 hypothetical protein [Kineosporia corallincola]
MRLPHGRLVVLGAAGAGKTAAMILLLLASLMEDDEEPVPVWLTLSSWDPHRTPLLAWVRGVMARDHRFLLAAEYGPDAIGALLESERVALFLDGLDEMPAAARAVALRRLDAEGGQLRIVVSSRPQEYREAAASGHWHNAAVVELLPPSPPVIADYLLRDQRDQVAQWRDLVGHLVENPGGALALTLNSPLTLSLARIGYRGRSPAELTEPGRFDGPEHLRRHLLARYLETAYPDPAERERAVTWLAWTAHQMRDARTLPWWKVPGWIPRRQRSLAVALGFGPPTGVLTGLADWAGQGFEASPRPVLIALGVSVLGGLLYGFLASVPELRTGSVSEPQSMVVRGPGRDDLAGLLRSAPAVVVPALLTGLLLFVRADLPVLNTFPALFDGLLYGTLAGFGAGASVGVLQLWRTPLSQLPAAGARGSSDQAWRSAVAGGLITLAASGLTAAACVLLGSGNPTGPGHAVATALIAGAMAFTAMSLVFSLAAGLTVGLTAVVGSLLILGAGSAPAAVLASALFSGLGYAIHAGPSVHLLAGEMVLRVKGLGRVRFAGLFADAHDRQVLRQVGMLYEFRHAELQDHLAQQGALLLRSGRRESGSPSAGSSRCSAARPSAGSRSS